MLTGKLIQKSWVGIFITGVFVVSGYADSNEALSGRHRLFDNGWWLLRFVGKRRPRKAKIVEFSRQIW